MIDLDTYHELIETLLRNKTRSLLTGFGVFWGVFMLVSLMGGGKGMKQLLNNNFDGFATNAAMIWAQPTTKPYHGFRKGQQWNLTMDDVERLHSQVPELDVVSPMVSNWGTRAVVGKRTFSCAVRGVLPEYARVDAPKMRYGRYINEMDVAQCRKVCVIGEKVYRTLFPGGADPCGQTVRLDSTYYNIVGVDVSKGNMNFNGSADESVTLPLTLMQQAYNMGDVIHMVAVTGRPGVVMSDITPHMRSVIARVHDVDPEDDQSVMVFNTEVLFGVLDSLFDGVDFLIWLVGIGTLLAGAIGVSNIMLVTVRERTSEIGIRRAIGATPRVILGQIIAESIMLTSVAGMCGILLAVVTLQGLELANTEDGILAARFQVSFWQAAGAVALLVALGVIAGMAPALRAMRIKPVDAMREE